MVEPVKIAFFTRQFHHLRKTIIMKKNLPALFSAIVALTVLTAHAQTRYLDEIFDEVEIQADVAFGFNVDALRSNFTSPDFQPQMATVTDFITSGDDVPLNFFLSNAQLPSEQHTALKLFPLQMDVYTPADDDETNRPVIIYLHTGNFLPPIINGGITGSRLDSAVVNNCKRWARAGYTAVALSYRLGWNPVSTDPDVRRGTLLQAVYRAIHDTQSGVRFLRASMQQGNPFGIDPSKILLYGQGSGGYVAQAYNALNDYGTEIAGLSKFIGEDGLPYVLEARDGNIDGGPGAIRLQDPLQVAGIDRSISMAINAGGALADISWMDAGEPPVVTVHSVRDPFAPFDDGTVVVPTTNENVVDVSGGNVFVQQAVDLGNNDAFLNIPDGNDPFTDRARSLYGQTLDYIFTAQPTITISPNPEGLFPVVLPINTTGGNVFTNESGPWDWWDLATLEQVVAGTNAALGLSGDDAYNAQVLHQQGLAGNPGMGPEKGNAYIDTIQGYVNPRIMCVLELEGNPCDLVSTSNINALDNSTKVFPNPSHNAVTVRNNDQMIRRIEMYDITGRLVSADVVNANEFRMERANIKDGVYLMQIIFDTDRVTKKVLFN